MKWGPSHGDGLHLDKQGIHYTMPCLIGVCISYHALHIQCMI